MKGFQHISVAQTRALMTREEVIMVDIRDAMSYNNGHIEGAVLLDNSNVEQFVENSDRQKAVVVYCYHGNSSQGAAQFLSEKGFDRVYSMDGGFEVWRVTPV